MYVHVFKAQTNLSQMWFSHWSFGLWVCNDDSDTRQDLKKQKSSETEAKYWASVCKFNISAT